MKHSETITKLAAALCKAQAEMPSAPKDKVNPHFKSKYADLTTLWDVARPVLSKHGLAVVQTFNGDGAGLVVETILVHESGEWIGGALPMPLERNNAQGVGSAITYARRYGLASIIGMVSDEDDDGNEASKGAAKPRRETPKPEPEPTTKPSPSKIAASQVQEAIERWIPHNPEDWPKIKEQVKAAYGLPEKPTAADLTGLYKWIEGNIQDRISFADAAKERQ